MHATDTDGRLTHVPDGERSFPGLRHSDRGMVELPLEVRHGLLWVTAEGAGRPIPEFLGPDLDADLTVSGAAGYSCHEDGMQIRRFNWKTGAESFMESYHFAVLHQQTAGRVFLHNMGAYDQLRRTSALWRRRRPCVICRTCQESSGGSRAPRPSCT